MRLASVENLTVTTADIELGVKQAYYVLLQSNHLVDVFTKNLEQQQAHVKETQTQEEVGVIPHMNVLTAQAAAASAQFDLITAQNNANIARVNLNNAMGIDNLSFFHIVDSTEPAFTTPEETLAVTQALAHRAEIRRDTLQLSATHAAVKAAATGNLPSVMASASYSPNTGATVVGQKTTIALFLNMQWTPLDFGSTSGAIKQARAQVTNQEETLYADKQTIANGVVQARLNVVTAEAQMTSAQAEIASAQENIDAAVGSYSAGVGIFLNVIDAQAALLKAQVDELSARYGLSIARATLLYAMGGVVP